ncbi:MAG: radical SAM protein [Candidatus Omnitrophica bacterium]|nr:radical SAM protein [Candidatus Omnitrophota bacterium]
MKILLVIPDYGSKKYYTFPLGIPYISSYLKARGWNITAFNANHYPGEKLSQILQSDNYAVVATGGMFTHAAIMNEFVKTVRAFSPESKIILGGPIAAGDPEFTFDILRPDFLITGEGERAMDYLLQALKRGSGFRDLPGIFFKENGKYIRTEPAGLIENLDEVPFPDYEGFEFGYYLDNFKEDNQAFQCIGGELLNRRTGIVVTTRDCVSKCTFCFRLMGGVYRARSLENVMKEINFLRENYKVNNIAFCDDMFAANKDRVKAFCRELKVLGIPWRGQVRVNVVDDELLKIMKDSGCFFISYGFESGSHSVLKSMKKGITTEQIDRAITSAVKAKISIQGNFIFGDPAETIETAKETIRFARKYKKFCLGFGFIIPYPGTELYYKLIDNGRMDNKWDFYLKPGHKFYNMTSLSDIDFEYLDKKIGVESHYRGQCSNGKLSKVRRTGKYIASFALKCQHCEAENKVNDYNIEDGDEIVCRECYQRIGINQCDFRFGRWRVMARRIYYLYFLRLATMSPFVYRIFRPFLVLFSVGKSAFKV